MIDFSDEELQSMKRSAAYFAGYQNTMDALEEEKLIEKIKEMVNIDKQTQYDEEYLKGVGEALQSFFQKMIGAAVHD